MSDVTRILSAIEKGDPQASGQLLPIVYDQLRQLAAQRMAREKPGQTLQPTALVHEAFMKLVDVENAQHWNSRGHFYAAASEAMRRILVDNARRKSAEKHGVGLNRVEFEGLELLGASQRIDLVALDEALARLEEEEPEKAELVKLRFFGGFSVEEAAKLLGISRTTASRYWTYARTWLYAELRDE